MTRGINIGGKTRTVLLGNLAYKWLKEDTEITLLDIGKALESQDITIASTILYYGLRAGEKYDKVQDPEVYDADDVALWMDESSGSVMTVLPWIMESISDMTGMEVNEAGEVAAKKKTAKKR